MICESDIAILIPTYNRRDMLRQAAGSALASGAGRVIVSDNASADGSIDVLREFDDPRLTVVVQSENLGLWGNHWALLRENTLPWVKFLHTDDWLNPGGLAAMAAEATPHTTVVSALPVVRHHEAGRDEMPLTLAGPRRWSSEEYMRRLLVVGNELGTPTVTLFRRDVLPHDRAFWNNEASCDLLINVLAASRGEVVLLPPGPVTESVHEGQDGATQSFRLFMVRHINSVRFMETQTDPRIRRFAAVFGAVELLGSVRSAVGRVRRGGELYGAFAQDLIELSQSFPVGEALGQLHWIWRSLKWKYGRRGGRVVDGV
jgi:glycosyltransferase involved in cell wall biosynthesis